MTRNSPEILKLAAARNAAASPLEPHQQTAHTLLGSYRRLLTPGHIWFLSWVLKLPALSKVQQQRLHEIASMVERGRR